LSFNETFRTKFRIHTE